MAKKFENDWHEEFHRVKSELDQLKLKLRREFSSFTVLCKECHGTGEVYKASYPAGDCGGYTGCGKCKGSGINKNLSFDLKDKVLIEVTDEEADWIMRDMDGLSGACDNEALYKIYKKVVAQIDEQLKVKKQDG